MTRRLLAGVAAVVAAVLPTASAVAAPGDLVPAFAGDGTLSADFPASGHDRSRSIVVQPDGKLLVGGTSQGATATATADFTVARYGADGTLDPSFSGDGVQVVDVGPPNDGDELGEIAIQPDGKVVAAGRTGNDLAVIRLNSDGTLDPSFSADGKLVTPLPPNTLVAEQFGSVALQPDGKILVAAGGFRIVVARYNTDGTPDASFAGDGLLAEPLGSVKDIVVEPGGKIALTGNGFGGSSAFSVARLNADGSFDNSFSGDGIQTTPTGFVTARALVSQPDGKLVAAGDSMVARFKTDGTLDDAFSGDGLEFRPSTRIFALALQSDGELLVAGHSVTQPTFDFAVERLNVDGTPDGAYGDEGVALTDFGFGDQISSVALQPDGKAVAAGHAESAPPDFFPEADFGLARYGADGTPDTSFSGDGKQTTDLQVRSRNQAAAVAVQPDGRIVVGGLTATFDTSGGFEVARFLSDGQPDLSFSGDGRALTRFTADGDLLADVAIQGDGGIVAVGGSSSNANGAAPDFAVARYDSDGTPDTGFSGDGRLTTDFGASDRATGVAIQPDGKLVVGGWSYSTASGYRFALARYDTDGTPDAAFSGDGRTTTDFGAPSAAAGVVVQPDGKIVLAGGVSGGDPGVALARYKSDGTPDTSFSDDGMQTTRFGSASAASAIALQPEGKFVVAGSRGPSEWILARYNPDGTLDTTFTGDGRQVTRFGVRSGPSDVVLDPDGWIVVAGRVDGAFAAARYHPSGALDKSFSGDGLQTTDFGGTGFFGFDDAAYAVALLEGDYLLAGADESEEGDFALLLYEGGGPPPELTPPETTITGGATSVTYPGLPSFTFESSEPGSTFQCLLVGQVEFVDCTSPQTPAIALQAGTYRFEVRALDPAGNVDPTPAAIEFEITPGVAGGTVVPPGGTGGTGPTTGTSGTVDDGTSPFGRMRATKTGAAWTLHCPTTTGTCAVRLTLYARSEAGARRIYGRRSRALAAGETRTVTVRLNRRGQRLLRRQRRLRVRFEARLRYAATTRVRTRRITLQARRP